jgi:hypothetical protein
MGTQRRETAFGQAYKVYRTSSIKSKAPPCGGAMSRVFWANLKTNSKLSFGQFTTEHSSDSHKPSSEEAQSSGFRRRELRFAPSDVTDTLVELSII